MTSNKNKSENYIDDLKSWQKNMYQPGAYIGANFSPMIKHGHKKIAFIFIALGAVILLVGSLVIFQVNDLFGCFMIVMGLIVALFGLKLRMKKRKKS